MKKTALIVIVFALIMTIPVSVESAASEEALLELPIVMYHHLSPKAKLLGDYVLSPEQLERDFKYLRENGFESITVGELIRWSRGEALLPEKPVMITFDDGYESTQVYGEPLLEKYGFKALVAVIGSVADLFTEKPDHMLDYSHLSWDALREISGGDVLEVQSHTYSMHKMRGRRGCGQVSGEAFDNYRAALKEDLLKFAEKCEVEKVECANSIAFPYGFYSKDTLAIVKELGFEAAFTCSERVNYLKREPDELFELCRYNRPHGVSSEAFFGKWK